ncbi:MAG: DUF551 domain-containing protein [Leclercia adecarboxylata]|nr:DUF551 domain-containing protein [Leclercia adecarboxylata]
MAEFTRERIIEELKASTQNASGMFEISEDTICALMSMLTYAAPQLPQPAVVSDSLLSELLAIAKKAADEADECAHAEFSDESMEHSTAIADWERRAAMLQGKAEPVRQPDELPMDYLQGHKDGLEWAARLAEANHPQTGDWLYDDPLELAKAIRKGPDMPTASVQRWIPCSERMPEEIGRYWCYVEEQNSLGKSHYQWNCSWNGDRWWVESENGGRVTHWMPLQAAPQQEVKSGR